MPDENFNPSNKLKPLEIPKDRPSKHYLSKPFDITYTDSVPRHITTVIKSFKHKHGERIKPAKFFVDELWEKESRKMRYLQRWHELERENVIAINEQERQRKLCGNMADRLEEMGTSIGEGDQEVDESVEDIMRTLDLSLETST